MDRSLKRELQDINTTLLETQEFIESLSKDEDLQLYLKDLNSINVESDAAALMLNKLYLSAVVAKTGSIAGESHLKTLYNEHQKRQNETNMLVESEIENIDEVVDEIKSVFSPELDSQIPQLQLSMNDQLIKEYGKFVNSICDQRNLETGPHSHHALQVLMRLFMEQNEVQEDDLISEETVTEPICAITNTIVEHPERAPCGHFFSKHGLDSLFQYHESSKCPVSGCSTVFNRRDCFRDRLLELEARVWKNRHGEEPVDNSSLTRI